MNERDWDNSLEGVKGKIDELNDFKQNEKPPKQAERVALESLNNAIAVKLNNAGRPPFKPADGQSIDDINKLWNELDAAQQARNDALLEDLARQNKLDLLKRRFNNNAKRLEDWNGKQEDYLKAEEPVGSINEAQTALMMLDAFDSDYTDSKPRVDDLKSLANEIEANRDKDAAATQARADAIGQQWQGLRPLADAKRDNLNDRLKRQQEMEALRKRFAEDAKDYKRWEKDAETDVHDTVFGATLEAVEQYKDTLDADDAAKRADNDAKKTHLDGLWKDLQDLGVTDNKYTVLTDGDIASFHQQLEGALGNRRVAYDAELERQRLLESKRKEFAAGAQAFVDSIDQRKADIGALQGEPQPLAAAIRDAYADGQPEREQLSVLSALQDELGRLGVTDNRHTKYTIPLLDQINAAFARWVAAKLALLSVEHDEKNGYAEKAAALVAWIEATVPKTHERDFDNTLEGIRAKRAQWVLFKNSEQAQQGIEKYRTLALFDKTNADLAANGRPAFVAPEGLAPADINAKWDELEAAEKVYEQAVDEELARQEKLAGLARNFNNEADDLEAWAGKKEEYLNTKEEVSTLDQAHLKLMHLDVYDEEYQTRQSRLDGARQLQSDIVALNYIKGDEVTARADALSAKWAHLAELSAAKRAALLEDQAREQKKEDLRVDFATKAKDYTKYVKDTETSVGEYNFGLTLADVTAYKAELDASDAEINATNDAKKSAADAVAAELTANGVTDNRHTTLTTADLDASNAQLHDALAKRQEAYAAELARQQLLEDKRHEWAAKAQAFVDSLAQRQATIDALTGEPEPLSAAIREAYADGKPEEASLTELSVLLNENAKLGISDNRHTKYNMAVLQARSQQLAKHVRNLLAQLASEHDLKSEYANKAAGLVAWLNNVHHDSNFDNTLEGARDKNAQFQAWKTSEKAPKGIEKISLAVLHDKINDSLAANGRPEFVTPEGLAPTDINAKWDELETAEKVYEQAVDEELARQEKLAGLARNFNNEADDLEAWAGKKEEYLNTKEEVSTLDQAHLKLMHLDVYDEEYQTRQSRLDGARQLQSDIVALNYIKGDEVTARADALSAKWAHLAELSAAKRAALLEDQAREQKKEDLRVDFATKAKDYTKYVKDTETSVGEYNFGLTLADVTAYKAELDASDAEINATNDAKKSAADAVAAELTANGVTDNRHTTLTTADLDASNAQLHDALAKRRAAYEAELARQQQNDALRREFADKAQAFVDWLNEQRQAINAVEGEPTARADAVRALHQDGKPGRERLDAIVAFNHDMQQRGIFSNEYTGHTTQGLETANRLFNEAVANLLNSIGEEKEMNERGEAQANEWKRKEELQEKRIGFLNRCKELDGWLDHALEVLTDPINVDSIEGVHELQAAASKTEAERAQREPSYHELEALEADLKAAGADVSLAPTTEKWNEVSAAVATRKDALAAELEKQVHQDALCKDFANKADGLAKWLRDESKALAEAAHGELEAQLPRVQALQGGLSSGKDALTGLTAVNENIQHAGIRTNKYTDLTLNNLAAQFGELEHAIDSQLSLLQKELLAKKESQASPEQIDEFKEVFRHFDKNNNGTLRDFEFKSCLNSLGENPSDAELAKLMAELGDGKGHITFDRFVDYMVNLASDNITHNEIAESFREIAGDKEFVTEDDLRRALPGEKVDYLIKQMPAFPNAPGGYDYRAWAASAFAR